LTLKWNISSIGTQVMKMMKFFTYILCSQRSKKYYIGSTMNLDKRVEKHNRGEVKSTKSGIPWNLVYFESFESRSEAFVREHQIKKKKSRKYIETLLK